MTASAFDFPAVSESADLLALRLTVRRFLDDLRRRGVFKPGPQGWARYDPVFSRALGEAGYIGLTWPRRFGGHERSNLERHVVIEELLAAGAPMRAHWIADRQSGPLLLKFGSEEQCARYLPKIAKGEHTFCIGMSEADSGSDLASIRTRATKTEGGWLINGAKLWTSIAHVAHTMILFARTGPQGESRHEGVTQFLVDLDQPGIAIRPILNLNGDHDFNEVVFTDLFVPDEQMVGKEGNGWNQVTSELVYERSGPDRWLSTFPIMMPLLEKLAAEPSLSDLAAAGIGRLIAQLYTLHHMSLSLAGLVAAGKHPATEAALVKDLGTQFERDLADTARLLLPEGARDALGPDDPLEAALRFATLYAPALTIRGGTREILRGMIAKSLGLR